MSPNSCMIHDPPSKKLSVVVVASNGLEALVRTLTSLKGQGESQDTEVIVVSNFDSEGQARLKAVFPFARPVDLPKDTTVAELRTCGINLSNGEIVAFVEDYGFVDDQWCAEIKKGHGLRHAVVGGAVENRSPNRLLNWAVYFFDYGKYMPPLQAGVVSTLSGINVSYETKVLKEIEETFRDGFHETFVHEGLKKSGHELWLAASAIVFLSKNYEFGNTYRSFFKLARSFAEKRVVHLSLAERLPLILGSCLLPLLLPVRVALNILPKRRHLLKLALCLPYLCVLMSSWSLGEFCGYLFAEARSAHRAR